MGEQREYVVESLGGFDLFPQTAHVEMAGCTLAYLLHLGH